MRQIFCPRSRRSFFSTPNAVIVYVFADMPKASIALERKGGIGTPGLALPREGCGSREGMSGPGDRRGQPLALRPVGRGLGSAGKAHTGMVPCNKESTTPQRPL
jgi:hypothetical protein